jgi:drug/metabolite transporter (DMT)-like permease
VNEGAPRAAAATPSSSAVRSIGLLAALALMWGVNWPAMKVVLAELPVPTFRTLCCAFGGIALLLLARAAGERIAVPKGERWPLAVVSFFNITGWHVGTAIGLTLISAGRASIIAFTMPAWAALLAAPVLGEKLTAQKLVGLALGVAGLAILVAPDLARLQAAPLGVLAVLGAAVSWAAGTVLMKRYRWTISSAQLSGWQLLVGGLPIFLATPFLDNPLKELASLSPHAWAVLAFVLLFAMVLAQWTWVRLVRVLPASVAAIGSMAVPVVGVLSSALLIGERVGVPEITALALVVAAIALVLIPRRA